MSEQDRDICPITGLSAERVVSGRVGSGLGPVAYYDVEAEGMRYRISRIVESQLKNNGTPEKNDDYRRLAFWVLGKNRDGIEYPLIDENNYEELLETAPSLDERIASTLTWLNQKHEGRLLGAHGGVTSGVTSDDKGFMVACCAIDVQDSASFAFELGNLDFVECHDGGSTRGDRAFNICLTFEGLRYCENLSKQIAETKNVFVAMWFDDEMDGFFQYIESTLAEKLNLQAIRIDRKQHNNKIDDEIIAGLRDCRFVIADFTCGNQGELHRGGVYYEAGFAHGLNKQVIFTAQKDCVENIHFDTRQFNHILWEKAENGDYIVPDQNGKSLEQCLVERIRASQMA